MDDLSVTVINQLPIFDKEIDKETIKVVYAHQDIELDTEKDLKDMLNFEKLGDLYITDKDLYWFNSAGTQGLKIPYRCVVLHAVCLAEEERKAYLYCQIQAKSFVNDQGSVVYDLQDDDEVPMVEIKFIPPNDLILDGMFKALSDCAALFPDPIEDEEELFTEFNLPQFSNEMEDEPGK